MVLETKPQVLLVPEQPAGGMGYGDETTPQVLRALEKPAGGRGSESQNETTGPEGSRQVAGRGQWVSRHKTGFRGPEQRLAKDRVFRTTTQVLRDPRSGRQVPVGPKMTPQVLHVPEQLQSGGNGSQGNTMSLVVLSTLQGRWFPRRQHRSCGSLSSLQAGVGSPQMALHALSSGRQGTVGPKVTTQVLWVPEQPTRGKESRDDTTGPTGP